MTNHSRSWILAGLIGLLVACGGGGGGDRAAGVDPGPEPPGSVPPPDPLPPAPQPGTPYAEAEVLIAAITRVEIDPDGRPVIDFQLADGNNTAITDLTARDVRFVVAKLQPSPLGNLTGSWQSYVNRIREADPEEGPGTEPRLQATYERDEGEFTNNGDGTYRYHFDLSLSDLPAEILAQAEAEGLNLDYEPGLTHRVVAQFGNSEGWANPVYDFVPATGETEGIFTMDIAATANCNQCHDPLAIHGSGRREIEYCVTCHNPGSTDPVSTNTVDMKVMIHKIHMGENLPSVQAGGTYAVGDEDYTNLGYPQDIRRCVNCHVGSATVGDREDLVVTAQGDNWNEYASTAVCSSCHEEFVPAEHQGGQSDDSRCASCHSIGGDAGSIADSHRIFADEAQAAFAAEILSITGGAPGEMPEVTFRVSNPLTGEDYDVLNDPVWTNSSSRLRVQFAWDTRDYHNTGNLEDDANAVRAEANEDALPNGDGSYRISMPIPIPDGSEAPGLAASGSGVAVIEGRAVVDTGTGDTQRVPLPNVHAFFSIDEPDAEAVPRRQLVDLDSCNACHGALAFHGGSRNTIDDCVTCHNPRNTDREERADADEPPADGKREESIHFKTMIHGIHAAGIREKPLQIGSDIFDEDHVHYPGNISNCAACHTEEGYLLPLADGALGTTVDTGEDLQDPRDDLVMTPITATCSSCHDDAIARAHMEQNGGSFATSQASIDEEEVVEQCTLCHGSGRDKDVAKVHPVR
jgi:OmcA/MtrC family decaheme c-type cytochrome